MRALLAQIQADAEARLRLPAGADPSQETARYRKYLKLETHRLKMRHRAGGGGRDLCLARAKVLDCLFGSVLEALAPADPSQPRKGPQRCALVALGGYGRAELNPHSDLDVMFLHDDRQLSSTQPPPLLALLTGGLLWDLGLKVGHSVRGIQDCVKVANSDMQSKTSLIEARRICGDQALFERMQATVLAKCVTGHENEYIAARLADQAARRAKYGDSVLMQEPNLKNGCGGLRDYQNLLWMAFFKYRSRTLADLEVRGLISGQERHELETAYDFLLRVRTELHYHVNRGMDVLSKSVQPAIAHSLGYHERSPSRRIEGFMRDYYTHGRRIYLITRTLEQRLALLPQPERLPTLRQFLRQRRERAAYVLDGFKCMEGQVQAASDQVFREQPERLMRVFRLAQQRGLSLHPDLAQLLRNHLESADDQFRHNPNVHDVFLDILNQRGSVGPILRAMHEVGLLGRYLPAFGKLTCLVQHEFYHQYTADEHTLVCLEQLDRLWGATQGPLAQYAELFQKLERPYVLYLALLLHDAGKVDHGRRHHTELSSRIALSTAKRLGLEAPVAASLHHLIRHHLEMAQVSQRRDLDDPAVIRHFAARVGTLEHLNLLTLHTYVDSVATSDKLWNGFKDTLLWALHHKTRALLTGSVEFQQAEAKQRETLAEEVRRGMPPTFEEDELQAHFRGLPPRYFQLRPAKDVLTDLALAHRFMHRQLAENENPLEPVLAWHDEPNRGYSQVKVCTWDRHGLFSKIAGALTAAGLNILTAEIFTRDDGIVLDTFLVIDAITGVLVNREERERFERFLRDALTGHLDLHELIRRRRPAKPRFAYPGGERMPTVLRFENAASETRTILDVESEDRVGWLFVLSQVLSELALDVSLAKICTEKGAVMDSFYVSELDGSKVLDPDRQRQIEARLHAALRELD